LGTKIPIINPATGKLSPEVIPGGDGEFSFEYFDDVSEFPLRGSDKVLYIIKAPGRESIFGWSSSGLQYFPAAGNSDNIVEF